MAEIRSKNSIEIERNIIEQYLMTVKDFVKHNGKFVRLVIISVIILIVISVSAFIYIESSVSADFRKYEAIADSYRMNPGDRAVKDQTIKDLNELIKNTWIGHAHEMSLYLLGNLLYEDEKYGEAFEMFNSFIKKSSSEEIFIPIAVNKASICLEEQGKIDEAIQLLQKFVENNKDSIVMDQVLYNIGRFFSIKDDKIKAREYYNNVISSYPDSVFSDRARERLFLLGAVK